MRRSPAIILTVLLALTVAGCATPKETSAGSPTSGGPSPAETAEESVPVPEVVEAGSADGEARAQARAWLEVAALPEGAVRSDARVARFTSSTGWPCGPVAELEAFWSIPGATVSDTANWIRQHPTGDLITTAVGSVSDDPMYESAIVGYVPSEGAQEGIVYTVQRTADGVAVRAEIAAQTATASCPDLPDGGEYGAPGQG
ncbi:hypothetical protein ACU045_04740 [Microbacterium sp. MAHUQ-60]|uniref:hypothetical protein n=1 Tax=unclassified Microbacterium TaxID=2609290 RepID=UPI00360CC55E